ncbi:DNA-binding response OmpR family regulator [Microbacterium endophyticum]|uniref:DNA-binding response OmpR family regulator n=1 Tax=Microbacterium endophyticum TaxID=1526412 RepID=A0A7W4V1N3_9MICO|nr:response regulator transcription factor [Microbacterium endophyticum]MBB2975226.1 DNA-binding response OmpR family regulator [Microbacterium endophyticum]NIK37562.1 DNA-binding response OmpR family regulator [Microbacterium endophyticum]
MAAAPDRPVPVLIVEDDVQLGPLLVRGLAEEGYDAELLQDGPSALIRSRAVDFSMAVLDVMLPGMSGFELCRRLRGDHPALGILMLTARDDVDDRVKGLDAGADDYLVKPFAFAELTARLRAMRRREGLAPNPRIEMGNVLIDSHDHTVEIAGAPVSLSPKEFALLRLLAQNPGEVLARERILIEIWGTVQHTDPNIVDQYVSYLRRKIDPAGSGLVLRTVRGVGFVLEQS